MSEQAAVILEKFSHRIVRAIGATGIFESPLINPLHNPDEPLEELRITHGGIIVPDMSRGAYRDVSWRNSVNAATHMRDPNAPISARETIPARYIPGALIVQHTFGRRDKGSSLSGPTIRADWQRSTAYVFPDYQSGHQRQDRVSLPSKLNGYEAFVDEETGLTVACMQGARPMEEVDAESVLELWTRAQQLRSDAIANL